MDTKQDYLTRISELEATCQALTKEIESLKNATSDNEETGKNYRSMVDQAAEGILVMQEGHRKFFNQAWLEIIGYSGEEYLATDFLSFIHPDDVGMLEKVYQDRFAGSLNEPIPEFRILTKTGEIKWISIRTAYAEWNGKSAELVFLQDATQRIQAEEALIESEAHLARAQEVANVGSWKQNFPNGEIIWSDETYAIFGLPLGTPLDYETFLDFVLPEDREYVDEKWQAALVGEPYDIEFRIHIGDVVKWVREKADVEFDKSGNAISGIGVVIDITERKEADLALRESQQNLLEAQSIAHIGHWEWDIPNNEIYWSDEVYRIYGVEPGTPLNYESLMKVIHPEDRDYHNETTAAWIDNRGGDPYQYRIVRSDGSLRYIYASGKVDCDENGEPVRFIGTLQDITESKLSEIALRESEARFRAIFEQAAVGIAKVNLDGSLLRINQKFCDIVGYSSDELEKLTFQDITYPDDLDEDVELANKLLRGEIQTYTLEKRYIKKDSNTVWVKLTASIKRTADGDPEYFIAVINDISDRKAIEQALNESEMKYRTVVEQANEGIMVVQDFERKYYNPAFREMTGYQSAEEYESKPFMELIYPDDIGKIGEVYQALLSEQDIDIFSEFRIVTKSGDIKWLSIHGTSIEWEGKPAGMVLANDVTERKYWEERIQSYQQKLKAMTSQMILTEEQERRRIAAELHDQVGQSLAFSRMQIAAATNAKSDEQREALLKETSETLKQTIQQTRTLVFDLSSPILNELGLNAAISELMEEHLQKQAGLKTELNEIGTEKRLSADLRAIVYRSVRELFNNVIQHAQANHVSVTVERTDLQVCISVEDDGIGFEAEDISSGLTRSGGFGLFSIQERMNDLGGSLNIQSAPGEGTRIMLCVPQEDS